MCLDLFFCQNCAFINEKSKAVSLIGHAFKLTDDDFELSI